MTRDVITFHHDHDHQEIGSLSTDSIDIPGIFVFSIILFVFSAKETLDAALSSLIT